LMLTVIGLSWMMLTSRRSTQSYDDYEAYSSTGGLRERMGNLRDRAAHASDKMHGAVDSTRDRLRQAADSSRETFEHTAESLQNTAASLRSGASRAAAVTREQAEHARERVDRLLHEQPLMLGALGLAAGAIIGALLPTTEHEDRLLGEMRNKAVKGVAENSRARFDSIREKVTENLSPGGDRAEDERSSSERPASRPH
jgi:ElaB/YqjD/DUF883 family membrane-anchored ribosome-binding protein